MTIVRTPVVGTSPSADPDSNQFLAAVKQAIALSVNVTNDTVSVIRRENDVFYDGIPIDRLRPDTNGPRVIMNDVQSSIDRVVANVAKAFYDDRSIEAISQTEDDKEAADQATKMTRHAIFNLNNGKILLRDSIKSAAKYPFGGGMRIVKSETNKYDHYRLYLEDATSMEEAEHMGHLRANSNSKEDYIIWKLIKVTEEKYETILSVGDEPIMDEKGKQVFTEKVRYSAHFEIKKHIINHNILLIPPEEFLINKNSSSIEDANFVAQRRLMPMSDIVEMWGEEVTKLFGTDTPVATYATSYNTGFNNEKQYRRRVHNTLNITSRPATIEPTMQESLVVEGFMRYDYDEDGYAEWRHFAMVDNALLENTLWEGPIPFILPNLNRDPHRPDEVTIVERAKDSQLAKTAILRSDIKAHQARNAMQILFKGNAFPLSGQRKLLEGTPGMIPFGNNEQGVQTLQGTMAENIMVLQKPDPSPASVNMLTYIDQQRGNQVGINGINDVGGAKTRTTNPATNAQLQERNTDIQMEDYICVYGETAVKPLFQKMWWFLVQDASHPCIAERFIKLTGKPCLDIEKGEVGEFFQRDEFKVNVGLGVDSPDYANFKAMTLLQVLGAFNQMMSGQTLPNILPKMFYAYQDAVKSLGYDPDIMLLTKDEFTKYHQQLIQQHQQQKNEQQPPDPTVIATVELLKAQTTEALARAKKHEVEMQKIMAETGLKVAETKKEIEEAKVVPIIAKNAQQTEARVNT